MKRITTIEAWRESLEGSKERPSLLLKFGMACSSSVSALEELRELETELPKYIVAVQADRPVSNMIEKDLGVKHESPQLLILKGGKGIWQATHDKIKRSLLNEAI